MTFAKLSRRRLIEIFVRHRYFYNQGNNTLATLSVIPIEKIAIIAASVKYLLGDHISSWVIYTAAGAYLVYRVLVRWMIGYIWHRSDGYDIESEWNKGKVPPSRVEVINWGDFHRVWARKLYEDITANKEPFDWSKPIQGSGAEEIKNRPDWVEPCFKVSSEWPPNTTNGGKE